MDPKRARQVLEEFLLLHGSGQLRQLQQANTADIHIERELFGKQLEVIGDPSELKVVRAGRRSGKSHCMAYYLIKTAWDNPNSRCAFIGLTRTSAKKIIWDLVLDVLERHRIPYTSHSHELSVRLDNGSIILLSGADTEKETRKFRGQHFTLIVVDECQEFRPESLDYLIKETLGPTLFDWGGSLVMCGTPGKVPRGFWWEVSTGRNSNWSVHTNWTLLDNEYMPRWRGNPDWRVTAEELLYKEMRDQGWDEKSPAFIREYLGQWVETNERLVYNHFDWQRNTFVELPKHINDWNYVLGVDYGISSASAILVGAWSPSDRRLWIIEGEKEVDLVPTEMANKIKDYSEKYPDPNIIADGNGIGKAFIRQMQKMYSLPVNLAEKRDKVGFIELLNDQFRQGRVLVNSVRCAGLLEEIADYQWGNRSTLQLSGHAEDHYCDALLYLFRSSAHYMGAVPRVRPSRRDPDWLEHYAESERQRRESETESSWWESLDEGMGFTI